ncbi:YciI family protein, partial [Singulisphaera rosea]
MKYMFLMYGAEDAWSEEERIACVIESLGICNELAERGKFLGASPLESVRTARTVRIRGGEMLVTEGPFAETTEQLGGYFLLDLEHLDEAIAVAAKLPPARRGTAEIRPIQPVEGLPAP